MIDTEEPSIEFPSRERSPFADLNFSRDSLSADLLYAVQDGLNEPMASDHLRLGQLLASAIWNGALLAPSWWKPWLDGLDAGARLDGTLWIEMAPIEPGVQGNPSGWPRRWFADPVSQILIVRWLARRHPRAYAASFEAQDCLRAYLMTFREQRELSDAVVEVVRAAELRWRTLMPGVLVEHACGRSPSFACTPATWRRLMTGHAIPAEKPSKVKSKVRPRRGCSLEVGDQDFYDQMLAALDRACADSSVLKKRQQKNRAVEDLKIISLEAKVSASMALLRRLATAMLTCRLTTAGRNYEPSSARSYLIKLRSHIFYPGSGLEELKIDGQALQAHCLNALEGLATSSKNKLLSAIGALQRFLQSERSKLNFDWTEFKELYEDADGTVNLVSSSDYAAAMAALRNRKAIDIQMLRVWLMLGFRAGLRATEIRALGVHDVTIFGTRENLQVELVVRRKPHANLKTVWSRRVLPLHLLLTPGELAEFIEWLDEGRRLASLTDWPYLFVLPERPLDRLEQKDFVGRLDIVLKHVTGDQGVQFGSLRHSFISNLLATLLLPPDGAGLQVPAGLDEDALSHARKVRLQNALIGRERFGQGALHAVSQLVGHAPVSTTLKSYAHLLDWSVGAYVCRSSGQRGMTLEQAVALSGLSEAAIRKAVQRSGGRGEGEAIGGVNYSRPTLMRTRRRRGRVAGLPAPSAYADAFLTAATRNALKASDFEIEHGEPIVRRVPLTHQTLRQAGADRLNWRLIKAVLDLDHGADGSSMRDAARRFDIPVGHAHRWAENRRRFMTADHRGDRLIRGPAIVGDEALPQARPRHFSSRTLRPNADGRAKNAWLMMETRNFPGPPLKNEIALVDQLWAKANVLVRAEWQHGLEAFRDYYDGTANLIRVKSWEDAKALCGALADLEILRHFQIDIRTRRTSSEKISVEDLLVRRRAPRGWRGQVIFRLKSRQASGRGYSIRFALTMLAIADCRLLAAEKLSSTVGQAMRYDPEAEITTGCIMSRQAPIQPTG